MAIESTSLNEVELSEYCRRKGLYPEQIHAWRKTCVPANASVVAKVDRTQVRAQPNRSSSWRPSCSAKTRRWRRPRPYWCSKKKVQAIWGEPEDGRSNSGSDTK